MKQHRRLVLRRETLGALTVREMAAVHGARNDAISFPVLGGCLESLRVPCYVDTYQPTRCMCP